MQEVWARISQGQPSVVVGHWPGVPDDCAAREIRVRCDGAWITLGAIEEAHRRAEDLLGARVGTGVRATFHLHEGPTRMWLDRAATRDPAASLVEAYNRLARASRHPWVLVFDNVDAADAATVQAVREIAARPGWLNVAIVLVFAGTTALVRDFEALGLEVFRSELVVYRSREPASIVDLPANVLRVLRAAAVAGPGFDAALVARLLDIDRVRVIEVVQVAADHGIVVDDLGNGRFHLDDHTHNALVAGLLPSLAQVWHHRLAEMLSHAGVEDPDDATTVLDRDGAGPAGEARAARHFAESGEVERGAERYLSAMMHAADVGAPTQAVQLGREGIALLDDAPDNADRRRIRIRILAELAQLQATHAGGRDFTLEAALDVAQQALGLLVDGDPAELHGRVRRVLATICFELGDPANLRRGLAELSHAIGFLEAGGEPVKAAALLNDQAALWVRLGDPVRAAHLLRASRQVFASRSADDRLAMVELAETDHLLARLALHVEPRPGQEAAALDRCLHHARSAAQAYSRLGTTRELARVWETQGRVETRAGRLDQALEVLTRAVDVQEEIGDVLGLAASVEALAEVLALQGDPRRGLALLSRAISLNVEKGSPVGLAHLRRVLERLGGDAAPSGEVVRVTGELEAAERVLGRVPLAQAALA